MTDLVEDDDDDDDIIISISPLTFQMGSTVRSQFEMVTKRDTMGRRVTRRNAALARTH